MKNSVWKKLWICCKTDYRMNNIDDDDDDDDAHHPSSEPSPLLRILLFLLLNNNNNGFPYLYSGHEKLTALVASPTLPSILFPLNPLWQTSLSPKRVSKAVHRVFTSANIPANRTVVRLLVRNTRKQAAD